MISRKSAPHPWSSVGNEKCGRFVLFDFFFVQLKHDKPCFKESLQSVKFHVLAGRAVPL
jgi:hypothetical protein